MDVATRFVENFTAIVVNPLLLLMFAIGLLVFVFGVVEFMWGLNRETDAREHGKQHMLWGVIGMFIMSASYSIVVLIQNMFA